jgi:N-acetylmuramoyl-L-alanine amidase
MSADTTGSVTNVAIKEVWIPSPHYSTSRSGYNKIVLHTTEGAMKIRDLGAWFQNPSAQCSSHHGADNYERGVFGAYVYENHKAWTQGNANPYCLSLEMCAYASWSRDTWLNSKDTLLDNAAQWIRYCVDKYNVPWTVLSNSQAQDPNVRGICQHINFGSWGSGHVDCGSGFPMDEVIKRAKGGSSGGETTSGGLLVSSAVAFYEDKQYLAYIRQDGKVCMNGGVVDPGSNAKSGVGLAINPTNGQKVISFTNQSGKLCTYTQNLGDPKWYWDDEDIEAK